MWKYGFWVKPLSEVSHSILLDGSPVEIFNPDAAIDEWYNSGLRVGRLTKNDEIKNLLETMIQLLNLNKCGIWTKHVQLQHRPVYLSIYIRACA